VAGQYTDTGQRNVIIMALLGATKCNLLSACLLLVTCVAYSSILTRNPGTVTIKIT
jgi:hypothetical protein